MSYTQRNDEVFDALVVSDVWELRHMSALIKAMGKVQFFYQESRTQASEALITFIDSSVDGGSIFNGDLRFPEDRALYSSYSSDLRGVVAGLQNALSFRIENEAKDTKVHQSIGTQGKAASDTGTNDQKGFLGQSAQDSVKRFEVLVKNLSHIKMTAMLNRRKFEAMAAAVWTAAAAAPAARP